MKMVGKLVIALCATLGILSGAEAAGTDRVVSYAVEDAAFQAAMQINTRGLAVKNIAFVKMLEPESRARFASWRNGVTVFENGLAQVPSEAGIRFIVHGDNAEDWAEIDKVFDKMADFDDYNPQTLPQMKKFKLCDALLVGKVIDSAVNPEKNRMDVRIALRLIKVETAEVLWGATVEGVYDDEGPDYQMVSECWQHALEAAAKDAVANLPTAADGYRAYLIPFAGPGGKAMTQKLLSAISASGRKLTVLDLPTDSASDRMFARFLRERAGTGRQIGESVLKKINNRLGAQVEGGKIAVLTGAVTGLYSKPDTQVDPTGLPLDFLTGSQTPVRENAIRWEAVCDCKLRDINDSFRVVAAVSAHGVYKRDVGSELSVQAQSYLTVRNIALTLLIIVAIFFVFKFMIRVR